MIYEHHDMSHEAQKKLIGENDSKIIHVEKTGTDGISKVHIRHTDYALMIASFLWHKIDEKDHGWAKQFVYPMWVVEAINRITNYHSSLNIASQLALNAIALGNMKPYKKEVIEELMRGTKAEKDYDLARN